MQADVRRRRFFPTRSSRSGKRRRGSGTCLSPKYGRWRRTRSSRFASISSHDDSHLGLRRWRRRRIIASARGGFAVARGRHPGGESGPRGACAGEERNAPDELETQSWQMHFSIMISPNLGVIRPAYWSRQMSSRSRRRPRVPPHINTSNETHPTTGT